MNTPATLSVTDTPIALATLRRTPSRIRHDQLLDLLRDEVDRAFAQHEQGAG